MLKRDTRILFFTVAAQPTKDEADLAYSLTNNVGFRNSKLADNNSVEKGADAVAGAVPEHYSLFYPVVESRADVDKLDKAIAKDPSLQGADRNLPGGGSTPPKQWSPNPTDQE